MCCIVGVVVGRTCNMFARAYNIAIDGRKHVLFRRFAHRAGPTQRLSYGPWTLRVLRCVVWLSVVRCRLVRGWLFDCSWVVGWWFVLVDCQVSGLRSNVAQTSSAVPCGTKVHKCTVISCDAFHGWSLLRRHQEQTASLMS